jgi:YHS domain-containing protein
MEDSELIGQRSRKGGDRTMAKDPVCGMEVEEKKAAATYEYKGKTYYFCAVGCKDKFAQTPEKFIQQEKK